MTVDIYYSIYCAFIVYLHFASDFFRLFGQIFGSNVRFS
jgi:hypothetical protein